MFYDFEYFCGANVAVEIDDFTVTEAVAISYAVSDSKIPIYGYSSRHFDGVAAGRVIVQGSLVVNYVHQDYLFRLIQVAKNELEPIPPDDILDPEFNSAEILHDLRLLTQQGQGGEIAVSEALKRRYWDRPAASRQVNLRDFARSPHDRGDSVNIKITFGERNLDNLQLGRTNTLLTDVFFTGRGKQIQIDQDVILEQYQFFARDIVSLMPMVQHEYVAGDELTVSTVNRN